MMALLMENAECVFVAAQTIHAVQIRILRCLGKGRFQWRMQVRLNHEWRVYSHGSGVLQSPWLPYPPLCHETLIKPFDDADVAHGAVIERFERVLISRALVSGDGLLDARELRHHDALLLAGLEGGCRRAARQIAAAERRDRRRCQLRIGGAFLRIGTRAINGTPIALRHCRTPSRMRAVLVRSNIQQRKRGGRRCRSGVRCSAAGPRPKKSPIRSSTKATSFAPRRSRTTANTRPQASSPATSAACARSTASSAPTPMRPTTTR